MTATSTSPTPCGRSPGSSPERRSQAAAPPRTRTATETSTSPIPSISSPTSSRVDPPPSRPARNAARRRSRPTSRSAAGPRAKAVGLCPGEVQEEIEDGAEVEMVEEFAPRGAAAAAATEPSTPERSTRFGERGSVPKELRAAPATQETRRKVFERHGNRCIICGCPLTLSNRQTHHPDAHANGGSSDARDLLPYCDECHGSEHQGLLSARWESGEIIPIDA